MMGGAAAIMGESIMASRGITRAVTGLAAGAMLTAGLLGLFALAWDLGAPFIPYMVFEWLLRVLPGSVVTFGLDVTLGALRGLGLDVAQTAKTAEQVLAVMTLFVAGMIVGLLFFALARDAQRARVRLHGWAVGGALGAFSAVVGPILGTQTEAAGKAGFSLMTLLFFLSWGEGLARLRLAAFPRPAATPETGTPRQLARAEEATAAEVRTISRRRFLIQMGGVAAVVVVAGADVAAVLRTRATPPTAGPPNDVKQFPNAGSPVAPVSGTRPEYTPVADFYRVDVDLAAPSVSADSWQLQIDGLVATPQSLTLAQIKTEYKSVEQFATLSCISNVIGGPLIGTTLWTGVPLRDVLARAAPKAGARFARFTSADDYDEEMDLALVNSDPRIILAYEWDRQPLTRLHGYPLRVFIPDRYGMKQPKWITRITLTGESAAGYWVRRNWDPVAEVKMTSVIDTVAVSSPLTRDGGTFIPMGGIAYSGAKGVARVEVQIDDGPWQAAELRQPLSELTWVVWRFDWLFTPGTHKLTVRAFDSQGRPQETEQRPSTQGVAATGLFSEQRKIEPAQP
jgi:DMSO/TMAO reductase YedYZ molybdopterin-dependent catalytic subunit